MGHTAGYENCVHLAAEHGSLGGYTFGCLINHRLDEQLGFFVAGFNAAYYFLHVSGAEVGHQSGLSRYAFQEFGLCVASAVAEVYEVGRRQ